MGPVRDRRSEGRYTRALEASNAYITRTGLQPPALRCARVLRSTRNQGIRR